MNLTQVSRFLSLVLRHKPQAAGITLDPHGWAQVDPLIQGIRQRYPTFDRAMLEEIVATDSKGRYSFNGDQTRIRANQGHSIPVDVELEQCTPPEFLWHGTGRKYTQSIDCMGLISKQRLYVHLSGARQTALQVGARHGEPVLYLVQSGQMARDGYLFYRSKNGVWLTKAVPAAYLQKEEGEPQPNPSNSIL